MTPIVVVIAALAVYRLTMLVVADELTEPWREKIIGRYVHAVHELTHRPDPQHDERRDGKTYAFSAECRCGMSWSGDVWSDVMSEANGHTIPYIGEMTEGPKWLMLLDCPWCASVHIGILVSWSAWLWGNTGWWFVPAAGLATSAVTGSLATYASPGGSRKR